MSHHVALTSAAVVLGAGVYGYVRAGSSASLAGGALLSSAFAASALGAQKTDHLGASFLAAAAAGVACTAVGARRWARAKNKVGPAILLAVGVTNIAYYSTRAWEFRENL
ncbi:hypothetical protein Efla_002240 [Eimeria flavescens]